MKYYTNFTLTFQLPHAFGVYCRHRSLNVLTVLHYSKVGLLTVKS